MDYVWNAVGDCMVRVVLRMKCTDLDVRCNTVLIKTNYYGLLFWSAMKALLLHVLYLYMKRSCHHGICRRILQRFRIIQPIQYDTIVAETVLDPAVITRHMPGASSFIAK